MADDTAPVCYWPADARLGGLVTGYHRYRIAAPAGGVHRDMFFPSWATIRIALDDAAPWSLRVGSRLYDPVPAAALCGPSSQAGLCTATRGTLVGVGILPLGWTRLFGGDVSIHANRVVPLADVLPEAATLRAAMEASDAPATVFDAWLLERLARAPPVDPLMVRLSALIDDPAQTRIEGIAAEVALTVRALGSVVRRNFGFTPKLLLRRARFLRALAAALADPDGDWSAPLAAAGYWDRSHFLRDSHQFLGGSIRDFLAARGPLNAVAMRVRGEVLGAPV